MAVPVWQEIMLPLLKIMSDGRSHSMKDLYKRVADDFQLSKNERKEMLPGGTQRRLDNRVGWARTHLKHALLIEPVKIGVVRITQRGIELLAENPKSLDTKRLDQFQEHYDWFHKKSGEKENRTETELIEQTPDEQLRELMKSLNSQLATELLEMVRSMDPFKFEQLVVDLLSAMGYGGSREEAAKVTQQSSDEGIDGVINEDRLGLDVVYIQAKRWKDNIGRKEIQAFVGALAGKQANKGVFITTSTFRGTAIDYAHAVVQKVILIDGDRLASLMIEYDIGVSMAEQFKLKKIDTDYFEDSQS